MLKNYYVSFGQGHKHTLWGNVFDKDCLAAIPAETKMDAHDQANEIFGSLWSNVYSVDEIQNHGMSYFPRGIIALKAKAIQNSAQRSRAAAASPTLWRCDICFMERPDEEIGVLTYTIFDPERVEDFIGMQRNLKYCKTLLFCANGAIEKANTFKI